MSYAAHRNRLHPVKLSLCLLLSGTLLTSCGLMKQGKPDLVVKERLVFAEPDPSLRTCLERLPKRVIRNDNDVSELLLATWRSIDEARKQVEAFNLANQEKK
jgi:hypothetical protein